MVLMLMSKLGLPIFLILRLEFLLKYLGLSVGLDKTLVKDLILWLRNWIKIR
jgi:hypothetical protein